MSNRPFIYDRKTGDMRKMTVQEIREHITVEEALRSYHWVDTYLRESYSDSIARLRKICEETE